MGLCLITQGIGVDCEQLRNVGGLFSDLYVANLSQISSYVTDANGYVTDIVFKDPVYNGLYLFEGTKGSHSAGYEVLNAGAGSNTYFNHTVTMKLFGDDPLDNEVIQDLIVGEYVVIARTRNNQFKIYGGTSGLKASEGTQNSGQEEGSDTTDSLTLTGCEKTMPLYFFDADVETTLNKLNSYVI